MRGIGSSQIATICLTQSGGAAVGANNLPPNLASQSCLLVFSRDYKGIYIMAVMQ